MKLHKKNPSDSSLSLKISLGVLMAISSITGAYAIYDDAGMGSAVTSGNQFTSAMWNTAVENIRDIYGRTQHLSTSGVNTGIGTTTPGTKLDVSGNIRGTSYGAFPQGIVPALTGAPDGKIFSPSGTYTSGTTWGINYNEGSPDYIEFNNASSVTSRISLDNGDAHFGLNGGSVGIGTSSPTAKLEVNGTTKASSFLGGRLTSETNGVRIANPDGASYATQTSSVTGAIKIKLPITSYKSNTMMRFTVKIYEHAGGSSGTSRTIDVGGYNYSDAAANWYNTFATQSTMGGSDINVRFGNDGTSQVIWIGETSTVWSYPQVFVTDFQGGYSNATDAIWGSGWSVTFQPAFNTVTQGPIVAKKAIDSASLAGAVGYIPKFNGVNSIGNSSVYDTGTNIGIGTTTPGRRLDVVGDVGLTGTYYQRNTSPTITLQDTDNRSAMIHTNSNVLYFLRGCGNDSTGWCTIANGYWPLYLNLENNDAVFGGSVYSFNYFYNSDIRLKKNIVPLKGSLEKILQLGGYTYEWKSNGKKAVGVIAQEVEKVFPELVGASKNADGETYKSVEYGNLVAPLIESVKELAGMHSSQEKEIEQLKKENKELNQRLESLEKTVKALSK